MKKLFLPVFAAVFVFIVSATGVCAADFDPTYYAQRYPEVANSVGCAQKALYEHYLNIGQKQGYFPNALAECEARAKEIDIQNAQATGNSELLDALTKAQTAAETLANSQTAADALTKAQSAAETLAKSQIPAVTVDPAALAMAAVQATGTYVDVDIENQTMTLFVNNTPMLSSPCVTGMPKNNRSTPTGAFYIMEKIPGKRLKGDTWDVKVDRWMKFTSDSVGLHDASWRKKFGGNIYKSNGSHGCVNLPKDVAYSLYDMVTVGTPVIVH